MLLHLFVVNEHVKVHGPSDEYVKLYPQFEVVLAAVGGHGVVKAEDGGWDGQSH
jgi:hypothetical protein